MSIREQTPETTGGEMTKEIIQPVQEYERRESLTKPLKGTLENQKARLRKFMQFTKSFEGDDDDKQKMIDAFMKTKQEVDEIEEKINALLGKKDLTQPDVDEINRKAESVWDLKSTLEEAGLKISEETFGGLKQNLQIQE